MHQEVKDYISKVKQKYPEYFKNKRVLEMGSQNFNGSVRNYFEDCEYVGIDRMEGKDVDTVCNAHEFKDEKRFDVVITTEMLEHDKYAKKSVLNAVSLLRQNGILIGTAANINRKPHYEGTGENRHYQNINKEMIKELLPTAEIEEDENEEDIRFVYFI